MSVALGRFADSGVPVPGSAAFGDTLTAALDTIYSGGAVVVLTDGQLRPRTVQLVFAACHATAALTAFTVAHTSGFLCVALPLHDCDRLCLPPMVWGGASTAGFAVTADATAGIGTGISAADRAQTILTMSRARSEPADLTRPGHVLPYRVSQEYDTGAPACALHLVQLSGCQGGAVCATLLDNLGSGDELDDEQLKAFIGKYHLRVVRYSAGVLSAI